MSGDCGSNQFTFVEGFRTRRTPDKSVPRQKPLYRNLRAIQENRLEGYSILGGQCPGNVLIPRLSGDKCHPYWVAFVVREEQMAKRALAWLWVVLRYSFSDEVAVWK
jgi:hypothetical protein